MLHLRCAFVHKIIQECILDQSDIPKPVQVAEHQHKSSGKLRRALEAAAHEAETSARAHADVELAAAKTESVGTLMKRFTGKLLGGL